MGRVWGTGDMHKAFWWGDLMERDHLEDPGLDGRKIYWSYKNFNGEEWTGLILFRDSDRWRALVTAAMNLRVP